MKTCNFGIVVLGIGLFIGTGHCEENYAHARSSREIRSFVLNRTRAALCKGMKVKAREIASAIIAESNFHDFDPVLIMSVIAHESRFSPDVRGGHGEIGLMQIKPTTAKWISKISGLRWKGSESLTDPVTNIRIGTRYLALLRKKYALSGNDFLTAYNMGPRRLKSLSIAPGRPSRYSTKVLRNYEGFYAQLAP